MAAISIEDVRKGLTAAPPSLAQHELQILFAQQRLRRAQTKRIAAAEEEAEAEEDLEAKVAARLDFIANNPDPQLAMPI